MGDMTDDMQRGIASCMACHRVCTETAARVLHGGHPHNQARHWVVLLDCAQMCGMHAYFMARRSPHAAHLAKMCAEICNACAMLCESHPDPDGKMQQCARVCRRCAASCETM